LVESFWKRQRRHFIKPWLKKFEPWKHVSYSGLQVYFKKHLDGGGSDFGQDFIPFLELRKMPRQQRVFEWCSGPLHWFLAALLVTTAPKRAFGSVSSWIERRPQTAFAGFLALHFVVWTVLPTLLYANLPLDLIEALTYGREWQLGSDKLPPLPWWLIEIMYRAFGVDMAYYATAKATVVIAFALVFATGKASARSHGRASRCADHRRYALFPIHGGEVQSRRSPATHSTRRSNGSL
jgi:hypothetical protein